MPTPKDSSPSSPSSSSSSSEHAGTCLAGPPSPRLPAFDRYTPGAILSGKYQLDVLLGEGGMGAVWQATNLLLDLPVAIKLIRADLDRGSLRARLQLEARSAAKLGHPGIVRVFDVGETEYGDPFIVMELLQGETLAQLLTRGRLSAARAVQLLLPIIDALGVAHARGIVHRDLKPDNVMLAVEQQRIQPKILDFGIAKLTGPTDIDGRLTEIGTLVGSPDYMSPEQARGSDDVDSSSDIWATCVVLYEAIAGAAPFNAANYNALLRAIVEDAPTPLTEFAGGDAALWRILERGLAKDRTQRYATMTELGRALAAWLVAHGVHEDACGTSLEAKWLSRSSDPDLAPMSSTARAISADFQPHRTQDSHPPYTATIRPGTASTRALSAVVVVSALLAVGALIVNRDPEPSITRTGPVAASRLGAPPALPRIVKPVPGPDTVPVASVAAPSKTEPLVKEPRETATPKPSIKRTMTPTAPVHSGKAAAPAARQPDSGTAVIAATKPAPMQPARPNPKPLDLLSPY